MDTRDCSRTREPTWRAMSARLGMAVSAVILIGGCSSVPDAANPVEWYKSAEQALFGAGEAEAASPEAGAPAYTPPEIPGRNQPFPNLGEGPERPVPRTPAETGRLREGLVADRDRSLHSDRAIPLQGMSGERSAGLPMAGGDLPLGPGAPAIPATPSSAEVIRTQIGQASAPRAEGRALRPADSRRPSNLADAGERSAPAASAPSAPAAASTSRQAGNTSTRLAFSNAPPPSRSSAPPPRPRFADVAPTTLGLSSASPPSQQPTRVDPPVASELPPPPPLRSAAPGAHEASELQKPEGVPDALVERQDASDPAPENVPDMAALDQADAPAAPERSDRIATIQFREKTAELGDAERDILRQVAALHQQRGGTIRVVGHGGGSDPQDSAEGGAGQASLERANAVAQELVRLGVSRQDIRAEALTGARAAEKTDTQTAEIYFIN